MNLNTLVLPGDGIGIEVTREAVRVLGHVARKWNHALNLSEGLLGGIAIHKTPGGTHDSTVNGTHYDLHVGSAQNLLELAG